MIPDTVQAVLAARFDLLDGQDKRVLQAAAVVGRVFWPGPVALLAHLPDEAVDASLRILEERELVLSRLTSSLAGQQELIFKHVLIRDVAYESLPSSRPHGRARGGRRLDRRDGRRPRGRDRRVARLPPVDRGRPRARHARWASGGSPARPPSDGCCGPPTRPGGGWWSARRSASPRRRSIWRPAISSARMRSRCWPWRSSPTTRATSPGGISVRPRSRRARVEPPDGTRVARLAALGCDVAVRWPGSLRGEMPAEETVRELWDLGIAHLPPGDTEERIRLLGIRAGWPFAFSPEGYSEAELEELEAAGLQGAEMALRMGLPNRASAAYDQAIGPWIARGWYGRALPIWERRSTITHRGDRPPRGGRLLRDGCVDPLRDRPLPCGRWRSPTRASRPSPGESRAQSSTSAPGASHRCIGWADGTRRLEGFASVRGCSRTAKTTRRTSPRTRSRSPV